MIENGKNKLQEDDRLLTTLMTLLNILAILLVGLVIWSAYSIFENSAALVQIMNGRFLP
jgi:hypothetical protein